MKEIKKEIKDIKYYPCAIKIEWENPDSDMTKDIDDLEYGEDYGFDHIDYDGQMQEYTRQEWREDHILSTYDREAQDKILDALDNTANTYFFIEDKKAYEAALKKYEEENE